MADGDPRVHLAMNLVLSAVYAVVVVSGMSVVDLVPLTLRNVALGTVLIFALTYVVVLR